jgi:hypothetical protein
LRMGHPIVSQSVRSPRSQADYLIVCEDYRKDIPFSVKVKLTKKLALDCAAAAKWDQWALQVWPHSALAGDCAWSIHEPRMGALLVELQSITVEKDMLEAQAVLRDAFETVAMGDWFYNLASNITEHLNLMKGAVIGMHDVMLQHPLEEYTNQLLPAVPFMIGLYKGIRGYLDPTPGIVHGITMNDVSFLNPFDKTDDFIQKVAEVKSSAQWSKVFKTDDWKRFRGAYQQCMGAELPPRGLFLKARYLEVMALVATLAVPATDEDLSMQSKQTDAVEKGRVALVSIMLTRKNDMEALREGALDFLDEQCLKLVAAMWTFVQDSPDDFHCDLAVMRDVCKALGHTKLLQQISDVLMQNAEAHASAKLERALEGPLTSPEHIDKILEAVRSSANIAKPPAAITLLQKVIPVIRNYIVEQIESAGLHVLRDTIKAAADLLKLLCSDPALHDSATFEFEKLNCSIFAEVAQHIVDLRIHIGVCSGPVTDPRAKAKCFANLAKQTSAVTGFRVKAPNWTGATEQAGGRLINLGDKLANSATATLSTFGEALVAAKMVALTDCIGKLAKVAGGRADGGLWCEGIPNGADKPALISAFDEHLAGLNDNLAIGTLIEDVTKDPACHGASSH